MKADDRILSAARKAKGCPFQGSSRVPQPWQDLKASRALKARLFGDRRFESFFLQRRESVANSGRAAGRLHDPISLSGLPSEVRATAAAQSRLPPSLPISAMPLIETFLSTHPAA
jgi:hypothetical protein